jgi:hypothetical protein
MNLLATADGHDQVFVGRPIARFGFYVHSHNSVLVFMFSVTLISEGRLHMILGGWPGSL